MTTLQRNPATGNERKARAVALTHYLQVALRYGLPAHNLMRKFGLDPAMLMNREQRISFTAVCHLLEASGAESGCMSFGIQMARARTAFDFGVIGLLLAHKRTLREVLLAMLKYRHLLNDALGLYVETTGSMVLIGEQILCDTGEWPRQTMELALGVLMHTCTAILGPNWKPASVHFTHSAPPDLRDHRSYFGCPVNFASDFNGLICLDSDLDQPNPMANPELVRYAEGLAKSVDMEGSPSIAAEVRNAIYLLLPVAQADIKHVANQLHMSVRSLQHHLGNAGTTFSNLIDEVRHDLAIRYMRNERYSIGQVAELLGYARHACFTQWFTRRFGIAPKSWRNAHCTSTGCRF